MLVQFAERNPGMTRVMVGDALVYENERLQQRMNQFFDKIEATLRQVLRGAAAARLGHAHRRRAGARRGAHGVRGRAAAALCALGVPPRAFGTPRSHDRADRLTTRLVAARTMNSSLAAT
jgi:hypothetical protein